MRENRLHGSEGGVAKAIPTPIIDGAGEGLEATDLLSISPSSAPSGHLLPMGDGEPAAVLRELNWPGGGAQAARIIAVGEAGRVSVQTITLRPP